MLRIKLSRVGKKRQPQYRILVLEKQKDPWGDYLENVGTYNPHTDPATVVFKEDRVKHWLSMGAQPTDTVHNLLVNAGLLSGKKRNVSKLGKKAKDAIKAAAEEAKEKAKAEKESAAAEAKADEAAEAAKAEAPSSAPTSAEAPAGEEAPADTEKPAEEPKEEEKKAE